MKKIKSKTILILIISLIVLINVSSISFGFDVEEDTDFVWLKEEIINASTNKTNELNLNSRCAIVLDRNSKKVLFGKNENKRVPMASTTNIMTI